MSDFTLTQLILTGLCFIWGGFVRTGLGFGGAALTLPILLLIDDDPLVFLPLIAMHLLFFSVWIPLTNHLNSKKIQQPASGIDWSYLKQTLWIILPPKILGVFGLLTLPSALLSGIIFAIVLVYSLSYILNRPIQSHHPWLDKVFLVLGGYISGTSLMGAPLLIAVYSTHVTRQQLRDTLFALWFVLVLIKLASFIMMGVDMQWLHQLWLIPCVTMGHFLGLRFYGRMQQTEPVVFYRVLGSALLLISTIGLLRAFDVQTA
ncbi:MAG: permease [Thiothrix nivea]|nr:MAG: permease [Thiothrix nivea]